MTHMWRVAHERGCRAIKGYPRRSRGRAVPARRRRKRRRACLETEAMGARGLRAAGRAQATSAARGQPTRPVAFSGWAWWRWPTRCAPACAGGGRNAARPASALMLTGDHRSPRGPSPHRPASKPMPCMPSRPSASSNSCLSAGGAQRSQWRWRPERSTTVPRAEGRIESGVAMGLGTDVEHRGGRRAGAARTTSAALVRGAPGRRIHDNLRKAMRLCSRCTPIAGLALLPRCCWARRRSSHRCIALLEPLIDQLARSSSRPRPRKTT